MKKVLGILLVLLVILGMVGCDLNPLNKHTQYFYSLAGEGNTDSSKTIKYRSDGHTIIMSRGIEGQKLTKSQAQNLIAVTHFSLTLDGVALASTGDKTVDELGKTGYHVVQYFAFGKRDRGDYVLEGKTTGNMLRENTVYLTIR